MNRRITLVLIGLLALSMIACNLVSRLAGQAKEKAEEAVTAVVATVAALPTATPSGEATNPQPDISKPELGEENYVRSADGAVMVPIPAGEFIMGADKAPSLPNERPQRTVALDLYWIDQTEVTNAQYKLCVAAGVCGEPLSFASADYAGYAGDDQPVVGVTWDHASAYCIWAGVRLPSEAEWEKAARGTDSRPYPWGDARPDGSQANMSGDADPYEYTAPVASFPAGASPYGIMDLTGNAREWVADWYQADYYASAPSNNPTGPASGELDMRVSRGGSFAESDHHSRTSDRIPQKPDFQPQSSPFTLGFRCATSILPTGETATGPGVQSAPTATSEEAEPTATSGTETSSGGESSGPVQLDDLDNLQSYRADWLSRITYPGTDGGSIEFSYTLEWVKEPHAQHVTMNMADSPFGEVIWIDDQVWVKQGEQWVSGNADETGQAFEDFHTAFEIDDEVTLVGTETVNGVRADHYLSDDETPNGQIKIHREVWIANQSSLPKVGVKAFYRMEHKQPEGTIVSEIEATLYDINEPITIEAPQ